MSAREEAAQRFLYQLRAQYNASLGARPERIDEAEARRAFDEAKAQRIFEAIQGVESIDEVDPSMQAWLDKVKESLAVAVDQDLDAWMSAGLNGMQDEIERTAAAVSPSLNAMGLESHRPLIGFMQTGQFNAVCMPMPGGSGAHLVLFDHQIKAFSANIIHAVIRVVPIEPADAIGIPRYDFTVRGVADRIKSDPDIAQLFENVLLYYAVTGSLNGVGTPRIRNLPTHDHTRLVLALLVAIDYFVLGHEYAHILLGHLGTTNTRKDMLPGTDAEALDYSWQQEYDADELGTLLAVATSVKVQADPILFAHLGISLYFDARDVMDRAVAVLQTGDENALQLGSHPPPRLRKQHLHDVLLRKAENHADPSVLKQMRAAIDLTSALERIIQLLWERTRPLLLDLHRLHVPAAPTWHMTPKQTSDRTSGPH